MILCFFFRNVTLLWLRVIKILNKKKFKIQKFTRKFFKFGFWNFLASEKLIFCLVFPASN